MFEYVWLIMLIIAYLVWTYYSIKDMIFCIKHDCTDRLEINTMFYIGIHIVAIFALSLTTYLT